MQCSGESKGEGCHGSHKLYCTVLLLVRGLLCAEEPEVIFRGCNFFNTGNNCWEIHEKPLAKKKKSPSEPKHVCQIFTALVQTLPHNTAIIDAQCSINRFNLGSAHLACGPQQRIVYKANICRAPVRWASAGWWAMSDAAITQTGLTTGPDNHLLEVRLTLPPDRSLSWICLRALLYHSTRVEEDLLYSAFLPFHISHAFHISLPFRSLTSIPCLTNNCFHSSSYWYFNRVPVSPPPHPNIYAISFLVSLFLSYYHHLISPPHHPPFLPHHFKWIT